MREQHYYVCKKGEDRQIVYLDYDKLNGFGFSPKNNVKYDGIVVNKMVIIKPSMVEKILKRKIKKKNQKKIRFIFKINN